MDRKLFAGTAVAAAAPLAAARLSHRPALAASAAPALRIAIAARFGKATSFRLCFPRIKMPTVLWPRC